MKLSKFTNIIDIKEGVILHNPAYNSVVKVYNYEFICKLKSLLCKNFITINDSKFINDLKSLKLIVEDEEDESNVVNLLYHNNEKPYDFTLVVTRQCNFRCPYCYEKHESRIMEWDTYQNILKFIENVTYKSNARYGVISFFGGEPLLEINSIVKFMELFNSIMKKNNVMTKWTGHVTTNGYLLTEENVKKLIEVGINSYQITIDGFSKTHDKSRYLANGKGTWKTIIRRLQFMKKTSYDFSVQVRMNYTLESLSTIKEYVKYLSNEFNDSRFHFYFEAVKNFGNELMDSNITVCKNEGEANAYIVSLAKKYGLELSLLRNYCRNFGLECYAANDKSIVFDTDGSIEKCTVLLDTDGKNILGNINNLEPLSIIKLSDWTSYDLLKKCKNCSILPVCNGRKCPAHYFEDNSDDYCSLIKKLYSDSVIYRYS